MSWSAKFDVPIKLPTDKTAYTLADARRYWLTVPDDKFNQRLQTALETLLMAADRRMIETPIYDAESRAV